MNHCILCQSPEDTWELGVKIGQNAWPGLVIALDGPLGAGKTQLAKGIAVGLGIDSTVTSPTYPVIQEYEGSISFFHIDLYRILGEEDAASLGLDEYWSRGVSVVEWPNQAPAALPAHHLRITIQKTAATDERLIVFDFSLLPDDHKAQLQRGLA